MGDNKKEDIIDNSSKHKIKRLEYQPMINKEKNDKEKIKVSKFCCLRWCSLRLI